MMVNIFSNYFYGDKWVNFKFQSPWWFLEIICITYCFSSLYEVRFVSLITCHSLLYGNMKDSQLLHWVEKERKKERNKQTKIFKKQQQRQQQKKRNKRKEKNTKQNKNKSSRKTQKLFTNCVKTLSESIICEKQAMSYSVQLFTFRDTFYTLNFEGESSND